MRFRVKLTQHDGEVELRAPDRETIDIILAAIEAGEYEVYVETQLWDRVDR